MADDDTGAVAMADVDAWLRAHLGRRLTVAFIRADERAGDIAGVATLAQGLDRYREIRVVLPDVSTPLTQQLDALTVLDPEIVLVAARPTKDSASPEVSAADGQSHEWHVREVLDELERRGILDRAYVALAEAGMTRECARRLGYEDGFATDTPVSKLAAILAREGVAVDERRRHGSSPPCYL